MDEQDEQDEYAYSNLCHRPDCGGTMERFQIWETCDKCGFSEKVECCHDCAGIPYPPREDEDE